MNRKLRMGMIGGGSGSFIGAVHRLAAIMDNQCELVCGCFSSQPEISAETGKACFLPSYRVYGNYLEMFEKEAMLTAGTRMDFVVIVTPNYLHFGPAMQALDYGFHVVMDKPVTFSLDEALQLKRKLEETVLMFALTLRSRMNGLDPTPEMLDFPGIDEGIRGMKFIDAVVMAGHNDSVKWVPFE